MVSYYDIAIIGAGVVGTSIAQMLSHYKLGVILLEKEAELSFGVSKSNSGIIHPGTQHSPASLKAQLCVLGNRLIRKINKQLNLDLQSVGSLIVAFSGDEVASLKDIRAQAYQVGVPGLKIVGRSWLRRNEPNLNPDAVAALYCPTAAVISPYRLVYALAENAVTNGIEISLNTKVLDITTTEDRSSANQTRFCLSTTQGQLYAKFVINAAGLYADEIAKMVNITDFTISARKGEEFLLDKKKQNITNHLLFPLPTKESKGILVTKTADGNPMIGPTAHAIEDKEDTTTSCQGLNEVINGVQKLVPSISSSDIIAYFAGVRPVAGNDFIIRHELGARGMITVAGIQSPGLTAAPAIAQKVGMLLRYNGCTMIANEKAVTSRKAMIHLFGLSTKKIKKIITNDPEYGDIVCRCERVSQKEIRQAIDQGATTLDGIKFRTRAQAGRCHGGFCTAKILKMLSQHTQQPLTAITKKGIGSEIVKYDRLINTNRPTDQPANRLTSSIKSKYQLIVVGAGPAGMAAALSAHQQGVRDILLLERDQYLGGILNQCIHTGFGLTYFNEVLTGPEYADRFIQQIKAVDDIQISTSSIVIELTKQKQITFLRHGQARTVKAKAVIMATGCRERTREMVHIPGDRPAGIYPAGLAQKLINGEGLLPGKEVVIVGSGDIGLIMARRFTLEGAQVKAVVEVLPQTKGLPRNVMQCLQDFGIPLYLSHKIDRIYGKKRVEKVDIVAVDATGKSKPETKFTVPCDTVLVSVGLIPENELIEMAGATLNAQDNTPILVKDNMTMIPGVFVCGNALKIYDVVDSVTTDSIEAGKHAAKYLNVESPISDSRCQISDVRM